MDLQLSSSNSVATIPPLDTEEQIELRKDELLGQLSTPMLIESLAKKHKRREIKRIRGRKCRPTEEEVEQLGTLVASGLTLDMACVVLPEPLDYETVDRYINETLRFKVLYQRAQAAWLYNALQILISKPEGLMFVLKNRHSRMFGGITRVDVTSGGKALELNSPQVLALAREIAIEREKRAAKIIDVTPTALPENITGSL
jgi:hypothetical protein